VELWRYFGGELSTHGSTPQTLNPEPQPKNPKP